MFVAIRFKKKKKGGKEGNRKLDSLSFRGIIY